MNQQALTKTEPGSQQLSTSSMLASLAEKALRPDMMALNSTLLSVADCRALLAASAEQPPCLPKDASQFARQLMGSFRKSGEFADPEIFVVGLAANFALFPASICRQVVDQVNGLPVKLKFLPTIAETRAALDEALTRRRAIAVRARWMLDERQRREDEALSEHRSGMTAEQRAEQVKRLLGDGLQKMEGAKA